MPTYKSFTEAIKDLFVPLDKIGDTVVKSIQTMIDSNQVPTPVLTEKWKARKVQNKDTRLLHIGYLRNATKFSTNKYDVEIGYDNTVDGNHKKMSFSGLAEVHNEGKGNNPKRYFLFDNGTWNATHKKAVENFIQNYYKNKGII